MLDFSILNPQKIMPNALRVIYVTHLQGTVIKLLMADIRVLIFLRSPINSKLSIGVGAWKIWPFLSPNVNNTYL